MTKYGISYSFLSITHISVFCPLQSIYQEIDLFLWLHGKFPSNAVEQISALSMKQDTINFINEALHKADKLSLNHDYISKDMRVKRTWSNEKIESKMNQTVGLK